MCSSDYFDSAFFYHVADLCHSGTFVFSIREATDAYVDGADLFTDQSVDFFQNSFVFCRFCRVCTFASIAGHHRCQTGVFRIVLKKIRSVLKCGQTSDSGTYIIRVNTWSSGYSQSASLLGSTPNNCSAVYQEWLVPLLIQASPHPLLIAFHN